MMTAQRWREGKTESNAKLIRGNLKEIARMDPLRERGKGVRVTRGEPEQKGVESVLQTSLKRIGTNKNGVSRVKNS